ncbi:DUF192 domain-containing protein [Aquihabitans sp. McL0605]|uniref:DUF192 domain-containing protein n=1 Tax=Aquihabitans sp. McL0605 TaxID=3415671 RepID=UPI003CF99FD4
MSGWVIVGVICVVAGLVLAAVIILTSTGDGGDDAAGTTPTAASAGTVVAPGLAPGTTAPTTPAGLGVGTVPERDGRSPLRGFGEAQVTITAGDGTTCTSCLLSAMTQAQRERGLMEVTDEGLGGYDGMLFESPVPVAGSFWMRDTPMPLSIAYFDAQGKLVSTTDMAPCEDSTSCPSYPAGKPFAYAVEVPKGMLDKIGVVGAATLRIDARHCPLATGTG